MPIKLNGSTSGFVQLSAPATAGSTSLELPTDSIKPGLVLVNETSFSAASSVSLNNVFNGVYENYKIMVTSTLTSGTQSIGIRLRASGTDDTSANYAYQYSDATSSTVSASRGTGTTKADIGAATTTGGWQSIDLFRPFGTVPSFFVSLNGTNATSPFLTTYAGTHNVSSAFDGITIYPSGSTFTGIVRVYGYRNSL